MATAYIVDAVRTAGGRRGGRLAGVHPVDLLAKSLDAVVERSGVDPSAIDDVVTGCVSQAGEQAGQVGRMACLLRSSFPNPLRPFRSTASAGLRSKRSSLRHRP